MADRTITPAEAEWAGDIQIAGIKIHGSFLVFNSGGSWAFLFGKPLLTAFKAVHDYRDDTITIHNNNQHAVLTNKHNDITPEGQIYAELSGHHVPHVPQCLASGDVDSWPEQKMQMRQHSQSPWACQKGLSIMPHTHYWLILDLVREALTSFSSSKELVQAIHDALVGELYLFLQMVCHFTHIA